MNIFNRIHFIDIKNFRMPKRFYSNYFFVLRNEILNPYKFFEPLVINNQIYVWPGKAHSRVFAFIGDISYEDIGDNLETTYIERCYWSQTDTYFSGGLVYRCLFALKYDNRNITIFYDDKDFLYDEIKNATLPDFHITDNYKEYAPKDLNKYKRLLLKALD